MTIFVFHGDDQAKSRKLMRAQADLDIAAGHELRVVAADKIKPHELADIISTSSLFSTETLIIEGLLSRPKSKDKDILITLHKDYVGDKNLILWDKKEVAKTTTSKLPSTWKISLSKPPAILFNFLDALYPGNLNNIQALLRDLRPTVDEVFIFIMLTRHITSLLVASSATTPKLPPWQIGKLKMTAAKWGEPLLIKFHSELTRIDSQIKTGTTKLDYASQLDILLLSTLG